MSLQSWTSRRRRVAVVVTVAAASGAVATALVAAPGAANVPAARGAAPPVGPVPAAASAGSADAVSVSFALVKSGFSSPVQVTSARDGSSRLFVVEQGGRIQAVSSTGVVTTYLDLTDRVGTGGERGLLSVAFHPRFSTYPYLWVAYATTNGGALRVARFKAASAAAGSVSRSTYARILDVPHPTNQSNHYAGQLAFGREGYLYISTGDGGGSGDPENDAPNLRSLQGKILRINALSSYASCRSHLYCVPPTNPYASSTVYKREIWARGLRNPWRFSVDQPTGNLWIGDVGQGAYEEVDWLRYGDAGRDLGWSCREGPASYNPSHCHSGPAYLQPSYWYSHSSGSRTVIGGFVYRGARYRTTLGVTYVFGDFVSGKIFTASWGALRTVGSLSRITSFGEDDTKELYAVTLGGGLYRMGVRTS